MIYVGTDIISVDRLSKSIEINGMSIINKIFTKNEQQYCDGKRFPSIHYAGKFAGKEAIKKAMLSSKSLKSISLKNIEIINDDTGMPYPMIKNDMFNSFNFQLSISHTDEYAIAFAIMTNDTSIIQKTIS